MPASSGGRTGDSSSDAPVVLHAHELSKRFGAQTAVDRLSLSVRRGECVGLLGPNGAGKSTTLKLLLGLLAPDGGRIRVLEHDVPLEARAARARIGVVPQADALDPDFTVSENLQVFGRYFGMSGRQARVRVPELLEFAGLAGKHDAKIQELSGGMKRRLTLARALVNDPDILFLDEPTTGLDPQARHLIWDRLKKLLASGKTILLTTHFMEEAERLCDRLAIIDHGRCITEDSPRALVRCEIEPNVVEVTGDELERWAKNARHLPGVARLEVIGETAFAYCTDPQPTIDDVQRHGALRYLQRRANLEDVFLKLTGRELRD